MSKTCHDSASIHIGPTEYLELSSFEQFDDGSGYCAEIKVGAGEFICTGRRFYFDDLPSFVVQLREGYEKLSGTAELRHRYEREFLRFEFDSRGHVAITGLMIDYGPEACQLQYAIGTDQTYLPPFIQKLESMLRQLVAIVDT